MDSLYIVMPAYNEEANIEKVIREWYPCLEGKAPESRLLVATSGSRDRTEEIVEGLRGGGFAQLEILHTCNQYHGPKCIALYDRAIKEHVDYVFQTDSDGQTNPAEFDAFWQMRDQYSAIFGRRDIRGDGQGRAFVEKVVCLLVRIFFGVKVPDANAPFRLMSTASLEKYLYRVNADYELPNIMLTTFYAYFKEPITFVSISFQARMAGENSINVPRMIGIGWKALADFYRFRKAMHTDIH